MDPSSSNPASIPFISRFSDTSGGSSTAVLDTSGGSSTPAFPTQLTSYNLLGQIGAGVNGEVHMATCLPLGSSIVAMKSINLNGNPAYLNRPKFVSLLSHPNILTAHCFFTMGTHLYIVMPFMSGGSLHSIITSSFPSGLTEDVLAPILKQTLEALQYLHSQGLHHGDIKADNILIDSDGSVKLTDCGNLSCSSSADFPYWRAPEVIKSHSSYGLKADIWSFGVTAMELAYGRPPLWRLLPPKSRMTSPLKLVDKNFSSSFKNFVTYCLANNPSERWTANELLEHRFLKNCKSKDYLVSEVLTGLPSVEERFKEWKEWNKPTSGMIFKEDVFAFVPVTPTETGREVDPIDAAKNLISVLKEENDTLTLEKATMKMEYDTMKKENESLRMEKENLSMENESLSIALAAQLERHTADLNPDDF